MSAKTGGVVFIHAAPAALRPHVEWAIGSCLGTPVRLSWSEQPAQPGRWRAELTWRGPAGLSARLASLLNRFPDLLFEVTEDPTVRSEGQRYSRTPDLGLFSSSTGPNGDLVVGEERLRQAVQDSQGRPEALIQAIADLLGQAWDDELEPYRQGSVAVATPWLRRVG
ncbi:MAG: DUF3145 domain-containing protein [Propionibacteriaceae bacterium]|jgi:hypothetical protein|nr:DUF3145 domain-containing protein [Propionibacteriaceae bacterium]